MYSKIQPTELLNLSWSKAKYKHRAQNVLTFIHRFNDLSQWVATEILHQGRLKKRTISLDKVIRIAGKLRELQNFNSIISILSGLNSASIHRLKFTWGDLPKTTDELFKTLVTQMSSDQAYKIYRNILHGLNPPCIPYLGVYLTDLTFIEDGNPNKIDGLINFYKRRLVYAVIEEIKQYQLKPYYFQAIHQISTHLEKLKIWDENECYSKSLKYEPRKAKKSAIK
ncbi:guanine nucleotide exchange factor [Anaeramoeba flamelloides]|uniref:Guanine nucleotide exchange factor n=1 Tax=Anaeramoeba flamelloides TaxID=1746091 RepID=A0ABQ8Z649_9EUKA|nr:guanine nucleotide exchange factor [Anaeramoeba flamelloides]